MLVHKYHALLELRGNATEHCIQPSADAVDNGNDHNRDAGGD